MTDPTGSPGQHHDRRQADNAPAVQEEHTSKPSSAEDTHDVGVIAKEVQKEAGEISTQEEDDTEPDQRQPSTPGNADAEGTSSRSRLGAIVQILLWTPKTCRWDPDHPPEFTIGLNLLFSFSTTATVGNLYYNQPILYKIADTFDVSFERSSAIATLMQAGYASGLLLLCPLADMLPRRPYILALVLITILCWLGLCLTHSFNTFAGLSYICGFTTVTPQLMLPLVGDLAPPHRRGAALAIIVSGLSLGMLVARVLSGVVSNYTSWRNIYWFSLGAQAVVFLSLYFFMPDYPTKNQRRDATDANGKPKSTGILGVLHYCKVLYWGIAMLVVRQPTLVQACLIVFCMSAVFTSYWTTLSFLLSSPPFEYTSLVIGLFGLIGIVVICLAPLCGRMVIDKVMPLITVLVGTVLEVVGVAIGVAIGPFSVAGPVIQAILIDFSNQCSNVALRSSIYSLAPHAQNRVNSAYMIASFMGQLSGTAAGNRLYAMGGWRYSGGLSIGLLCFAILVCLARGPKETGWVGWHGGWQIRKVHPPKKPKTAQESGGEEGVVGTTPIAATTAEKRT